MFATSEAAHIVGCWSRLRPAGAVKDIVYQKRLMESTLKIEKFASSNPVGFNNVGRID